MIGRARRGYFRILGAQVSRSISTSAACVDSTRAEAKINNGPLLARPANASDHAPPPRLRAPPRVRSESISADRICANATSVGTPNAARELSRRKLARELVGQVLQCKNVHLQPGSRSALQRYNDLEYCGLNFFNGFDRADCERRGACGLRHARKCTEKQEGARGKRT
jgi:hypothetical protein